MIAQTTAITIALVIIGLVLVTLILRSMSKLKQEFHDACDERDNLLKRRSELHVDRNRNCVILMEIMIVTLDTLDSPDEARRHLNVNLRPYTRKMLARLANAYGYPSLSSVFSNFPDNTFDQLVAVIVSGKLDGIKIDDTRLGILLPEHRQALCSLIKEITSD